LLVQSSFTALAADFESLARKAFLTVVRQERSCAVNAIALEVVIAKASAATATMLKISFITGLWPGGGHCSFLFRQVQGGRVCLSRRLHNPYYCAYKACRHWYSWGSLLIFCICPSNIRQEG
jgi:hypothetical protein